jgi:hypothetical protein
MKTSSATSLLSAGLLSTVFAAALLTGCYTGDPYDHHHNPGYYDNDRDSSERGEHHAREVSGTVARVDDDEHTIVLEARGRDREIVLSYDDETTLDFQGKTYRPGKLEPGDKITAMVERTDEGLMVQAIHVLSDARGDRGDRGDRADRNDRADRGDRDGRDDRDRADGDHRDHRGDQNDRDDQDGRSATDLRGVVRSTDAPNRILEIERSGSREGSDLVEVHYDDDTVVEFQGHGYAAERLDQGDVVEVEIRGSGGQRMIADRIVVVAEARSAGH